MQEHVEKIPEFTTDHDIIYHAALEGNKNVITALLKKGGVIDELNSSLLSPAGQLAKEGNRVAAELLRKWFGANVNAILHGATLGDQQDYMNDLCTLHGASYISWVNTDSYAASKQIDKIVEQLYQSAKDANCLSLLETTSYLRRLEILKSQYYIENHALYDEVYHTAKALHAEKLKDLIKSDLSQDDACIRYVASRLASEGFFEAAKLLSTDLCMLMQAAAIGNQSTYIEPFHALILANRKEVLYRKLFLSFATGCGIGAHRNYINHACSYYLPSKSLLPQLPTYLSRENYLMLVMRGLMLNGHLNYFWQLKKEAQKHSHLPVYIHDNMKWIEKSGLFANETIALHTLTFIHSTTWKKLIANNCDKLKHYQLDGFFFFGLMPFKNFSVLKLLSKANAVKHFMEKYPLNYDEVLAWLKPEIQTIVLQMKLPNECLSLIITYLSPIAYNDALSLCLLMPTQIYKSFLINELKKYVSNFDSGHTKRALGLINACEFIASKSDLYNVLHAQKEIISRNGVSLFAQTYQNRHEKSPKHALHGKYLEIIERHHARL